MYSNPEKDGTVIHHYFSRILLFYLLGGVVYIYIYIYCIYIYILLYIIIYYYILLYIIIYYYIYY